jgi:anti-sigma factor ChrR (cupin superfamily)
MSESINGDLSVRAMMDTEAMQWAPSPSGTVWRKRVHLVGPPESGQVTSIVRYEPNASFPAHDHPDGEEILVLDGVFSDEHGDWPAGTYLLNPEGFRHAPFSEPGCILFVKLRQFPGHDREHHVIDTHALDWRPTTVDRIFRKPLYSQAGFADTTSIERWEEGASPGLVTHEHGAEWFLLDGEIEDEDGVYPAGSWLRFPAGARHEPRALGNCQLYVKRAGLAYLDGVGENGDTFASAK